MILRRVQRREVVVIVLNLGTLEDLEAHAGEDIDQLVPDLRDRMQIAGNAPAGGHGDVDLLALILRLQLPALHLIIHGIEIFKRPVLESVDVLAEFSPLRRIDILHITHELSDPSALIQETFLQLIDRFRIRQIRGLFEDLFLNGSDPSSEFFQICHVILLLSYIRSVAL